MYKAIIFDFFDVIRTDAYKTWLNLHNYQLKGEFLAVVQRMDRGEITIKQFLQALSDITGQAPDEILTEMESGASIDHAVLDLIDQLRPRYRIALLSNAPSEFLRALLREHNLEKHFDEIVISSEVGLIKPQPEIFHHLLDRLGVSPRQTIFIDDSPKNITGAQAIGLTALLYSGIDQLKTNLRQLGIIT